MILFYDMGHYNVNGPLTYNQEPIKQYRHEHAFYCPLVPVYWCGLTLILAWRSNYINYNMWDKLTYPSQTSTIAPLKFGNG